MDIKELLDDEGANPKKFFDKKEYNTIFVGRDGFSPSVSRIADMITDLLDRDLKREEQEEIFTKLKAGNAQDLLMEAISNLKKTEDKALICAACWESGLDFSKNLLYFTRLACDPDFSLSMEALTVVENMESKIEEKELAQAMNIALSAQDGNKQIIEDLISALKSKMA